MLNKTILMGTSMLMASMIFAPAMAQDDEIIITATKREQTLQEVPIAVTVTTSETIEKARILDIIDLQSVVPSLRVSQLQNSAQTNFIIRGFGNGANNAGIEPSVGVFIDGIYRSRSASQIADLPNIERVEVLRGPQSTLFGKNASAGVISVVTKKPEFEQTGFLEGTYGNFNTRAFKGYLTGPVTDRVAYSVGGTYNTRDGYADNVALGSKISDRNRYAIRGELLFEATDNASWRLIGDFDKVNEICCAVSNLVNGPTGAILPLLGGAVVPEDPFSYDVSLNFDPTNEGENYGVSLQGDIDLNENLTLTTLTAYRTTSLDRDGDVDFTSADLIGGNAQSLEIDTFTQELRVASNYDGRFNFLAGVFYFDETVDQDDSITFGNDFRNFVDFQIGGPGSLAGLEANIGAPNGLFFQSGNGTFSTAKQDNRSFSIFGQADFEISERLTATVGVSYVSDEKDVDLNQLNTSAFSQLDFRAIGFAGAFGAITGLPPTPANIFNPALAGATAAAAQIAQTPCSPMNPPPACNAGLALQPLQFLPQLQGFPNAGFDGSTDDDNVDYTVRLAYDWTDNINVYASYATGYKASSFNLSRDSRPTNGELDTLFGAPVPDPLFGGTTRPGQPSSLSAGTRFAAPEEAEVFEIGLKGRFERGTVNLAIFDQTIENFQTNLFLGTSFALSNAPEQSTRGLEVEASFFATENWTLGFAGTFLDPEYDSFPNSTIGDISGTQPGGIHEQSIVVTSNWNWERGAYTGFVRADYQYEDEIDIQDGGDANPFNQLLGSVSDARGRTREVNLVNASIGFSRDDWDFTLYGRNIFAEEFLITNFPSVAQTGSVSGYPNAPRTYGLSLRKSF